jgi:hypothetical protein
MVIGPIRMICTRHLPCIGKEKTNTKIWLNNLVRRDHLWDSGADGSGENNKKDLEKD